MKKGKYLITGCAGFIGSNLVKNLYKNYELILVDDLSEGSVTNLPSALRKKLIKKKNSIYKKIKCLRLASRSVLSQSSLITETNLSHFQSFY